MVLPGLVALRLMLLLAATTGAKVLRIVQGPDKQERSVSVVVPKAEEPREMPAGLLRCVIFGERGLCRGDV